MAFDGKNIVDRFGRVHDYLRISLTERCNLRCFYCMPEEGVPLRDKAEFMSHEELISITKTFVDMGVKKIRLTGGEPMIKKNFKEILRDLGQMNVELAITTNGVLANQFIDDLKNAGVSKINVSLDSLKRERFNKISRREYFDRIFSNINLLIDNGFQTKVNIVLIKGVNDDEIIDFVNWSIRDQIQIRFIEFMPFDGNNWNTEKKVSYAEILNVLNKHFGTEMIQRLEDHKNDTMRNFKIKGSIGSFGIISSVTNPFCSTCNRIRLTADGKIKNCLFSQDETDLLSELREGKDLKSSIVNAIDTKYAERGGLDNFDSANLAKLKNRSMVRIGG